MDIRGEMDGKSMINLGKIAIYIILGIIVVAFLAFLINTIRCYLNNPINDEDDFDELDNQNYSNPNEKNRLNNN